MQLPEPVAMSELIGTSIINDIDVQYVPNSVFESDKIRFRQRPDTYGGFAHAQNNIIPKLIPVGHWSHLNTMVFVEPEQPIDPDFTTKMQSPMNDPPLLSNRLTSAKIMPTIRRSIKIMYEALLGRQTVIDIRRKVLQNHAETKKVRDRNINRFTTITEEPAIERKLSFRGRSNLEKVKGWGSTASLGDNEGASYAYQSLKSGNKDSLEMTEQLKNRKVKSRRPLTRAGKLGAQLTDSKLPALPIKKQHF